VHLYSGSSVDFISDAVSGRPQIEELMVAAKTSLFFIDDMQIVRPGEVGSDLIRTTAAAMGIPLV